MLSSLSCFLEKPPRGSKCQKSSLSAIINKRGQDGIIEKKLKRDKKPQQKIKLHRRLHSICTKIDEGNVKAAIRMAIGDNNIAGLTVDNYAALKLKHPQSEGCSVPSTRLSCPSPTGSSACLVGVLPQILKNLTAKSNGQTGQFFLRALTNFVNVIGEEKVLFELGTYFFGAKLFVLNSPMEEFVISR